MDEDPILLGEPTEDVQPDPQQAQDDAEHRQMIEEGLRSGQLRYTPQQKQQLARNAQARAWLLSNNVPDDVRQSELASLDEADRKICPVPVPADERPVPPQQQIGRMAYVDRDGAFGAPGATWVMDPQTKKWDLSRNAPNNKPEYSTQPEPTEQPGAQFDKQQPSQGDRPETIQVGNAYLAQQGYNGSMEDRIRSRIYNDPDYGPVTLDRNGAPMAARGLMQQKLQQQKLRQQQDDRQQQVQAKQQQAKLKQQQTEAAVAKEFRKEVLDEYHRQMKVMLDGMKAANQDLDSVPELSAEQKKAAWDEAYRTTWQARRMTDPKEMQRNNDYSGYLQQKYVGLSDDAVKSMNAADGSVELQRRSGSSPVFAPNDWKSSGRPPMPAGMIKNLLQQPPETLLKIQQHVLNERPYTREEYRRLAPKANYQQYLQLYKAVEADPNFAELQAIQYRRAITGKTSALKSADAANGVPTTMPADPLDGARAILRKGLANPQYLADPNNRALFEQAREQLRASMGGQ